MLAPAGQTVRRPGSILREGFMDMDDRDDIGVAFDSPEAIAEMRARHLRLALELQELGVRGLAELRRRGDLTAAECKELLDAGLQLERTAAPGGSRKQH